VNEQIFKLSRRIRREMPDLEQVLSRIHKGWQRAQTTADDCYLDSVALNLHGLYSGLERLFEQIAATIDQCLPQGANWHRMLLEQMASEQPGLRPAVISARSHKCLDEYRGFRHVVRNVYAYRFNAAKLKDLVEQASEMFLQVKQELLAFADFIDQAINASTKE